MTLSIDIKKTIKQQVILYLPDARVFLFGSRARGDNESNSDVDLLVISNREFTPSEKIKMESKLCKSLVDAFFLPFDSLVYSEKEVALKRNEKSLVLFHALKEGVEL
jgi:predicted nucleotidyltransferase